jgi:thymidine kinase
MAFPVEMYLLLLMLYYLMDALINGTRMDGRTTTQYCIGHAMFIVSLCVLVKAIAPLGKRFRPSRVDIHPTASMGVGWHGLYIFTGPMGSGKTTELIRRINILKTKKTVLCLCYGGDSERQAKQVNESCGTDMGGQEAQFGKRIQTHNGLWTEATPMRGRELMPVAETESYRKADVVTVDDGQFFTDIAQFALRALLDGKGIMVSTLDSDSNGKSYFPFETLIPIATSIVKFTGMCRYCDSNSIQTVATFKKDSINVVGGMDMYAPVCLDHAIKTRREATN